MGYGEGRGYWVQPRSLPESSKAPMVLVVHENRGLNPYIKDVARRLAKQGYIAFAPDALYSLGGYPGNDDEGSIGSIKHISQAAFGACNCQHLTHDYRIVGEQESQGEW
jgi:dienelactone hydrolase